MSHVKQHGAWQAVHFRNWLSTQAQLPCPRDSAWEFESLHAADGWTPAGDILAARIAQMQAAADEAADAEPQAVEVPTYMEAVLQCAAERRALLRGALHALWGW